jgi:(E)-4-hydroxy-3-methylbut-2-enyl-diphosphate synthase
VRGERAGRVPHANIGISLPGTFEEPKAPVYVDGEHFTTLKGDGLVDEFKEILLDYIRSRYGSGEPAHEEAGAGAS